MAVARTNDLAARTLFAAALKGDHGAALELLQAANCMIGPLLYAAAREGNDPLVTFMLDHGVDPNLPGGGRDFDYPLVVAAEFGRVSTVAILLDAGADLRRFSQECGYTALAAAVKSAHEEVVRLLVQRGAPVDGLVLHVAKLHLPPHSPIASLLKS